jgi:hypothetical protein
MTEAELEVKTNELSVEIARLNFEKSKLLLYTEINMNLQHRKSQVTSLQIFLKNSKKTTRRINTDTKNMMNIIKSSMKPLLNQQAN